MEHLCTSKGSRSPRSKTPDGYAPRSRSRVENGIGEVTYGFGRRWPAQGSQWRACGWKTKLGREGKDLGGRASEKVGVAGASRYGHNDFSKLGFRTVTQKVHGRLYLACGPAVWPHVAKL
jgi:hypothetical protein